MMRWLALLVVGALILSGCASRDSSAPSDEGTAEPEETPAPDPRDERDDSDRDQRPDKPAVAELTRKAEVASGNGHHSRAVELLERALRLSPRNAGLWQNLAVVRYRQGRYTQAETLAARSNRLGAADAELRRRNWSLIAAARRQRGDADGAREARRRSRAAAEEVASP